jgi:hypothetical protein
MPAPAEMPACRQTDGQAWQIGGRLRLGGGDGGGYPTGSDAVGRCGTEEFVVIRYFRDLFDRRVEKCSASDCEFD